MIKLQVFYRYFLFIAITLLVIGLIIFLAGYDYVGPFIILGLLLLAIGFRGSATTRKYSYTVIIFSSVSAALFYPEPFISWGSFQLRVLIVPLLQLIMFGMGTSMSFKDFICVIKMPVAVGVGIACQFLIMPIIGLILTLLFSFPAEIAAGVMLIGSSPSGLASNVMSYIAKANLALSVTLTACASLLAPLLTPLLMQLLAGQFIPVDFWAMMWSIVKIVILPIIAGLIFNIFSMERLIGWIDLCHTFP